MRLFFFYAQASDAGETQSFASSIVGTYTLAVPAGSREVQFRSNVSVYSILNITHYFEGSS
jgi:hypothetical protein